MRSAWLLAVLPLLPALARPVAAEEAQPAPAAVRAVDPMLRKRLKLHAFYRKHLDVAGLPILASERAPDPALHEAGWIVAGMLKMRPDLLHTLALRGIRLCVMSHEELTTQVPEHSTLAPAKWWDFRARGLGPGPQRPIVSCGAENLLGYVGDPYAGESILVHEFAHAIDLEALRVVDPTFEGRLAATYKTALAAGLWKGLYAATNKEEYWAEGVQSWFGANRVGDPKHGGVDTRSELRAYDPALAALIETSLGATNPWQYRPTAARGGQGHLAGYDRAQAPTFRWPSGLEGWYWAYERAKQQGLGRVDLPALAPAASPPRSPTTWHETRILFMNRTRSDLDIWWLGYGGTRQPYGMVRAGENAERSTLVHHIWILTDEGGTEVARFRAGLEPGRAVVRDPSDER